MISRAKESRVGGNPRGGALSACRSGGAAVSEAVVYTSCGGREAVWLKLKLKLLGPVHLQALQVVTSKQNLHN